MGFDAGEVVLVPFPFTDQTSSKRRPAVVVSNRSYNGARHDVVLMPITSQVRPTPGFGEVWIAEWRDAGLLKPSVVKPVFATLEQQLVLRCLGRLGRADFTRLFEGVRDMLG